MADSNACYSCSMPIRTDGDKGGDHNGKSYCQYCWDKTNNKPYPREVRVKGMAQFIAKTMPGTSEEKALEMAENQVPKE